VLPKLLASRPENICELVQLVEAYFTFYVVEWSEVMGHCEVPDSARQFPLMRERGRITPERTEWFLWDGANRWPVEELTTDVQKLSIAEIWNRHLLVNRVGTGWRPADDVGVRRASTERAQKRSARDGTVGAPPETADSLAALPDLSKARSIAHYLYFSTKRRACQAAARLRREGLSSEVRLSVEGESWLVLARRAVTEVGQTATEIRRREHLEAVAEELEGEYDGWEVELVDNDTAH
jgi:hypothetical protein